MGIKICLGEKIKENVYPGQLARVWWVNRLLLPMHNTTGGHVFQALLLIAKKHCYIVKSFGCVVMIDPGTYEWPGEMWHVVDYSFIHVKVSPEESGIAFTTFMRGTANIDK